MMGPVINMRKLNNTIQFSNIQKLEAFVIA